MKEEPILNYIPGSISFADFGTGQVRSIGKTVFMLVDETKAKKIVRGLLKRGRKIESAELGLDGDWRENSSTIYDGKKFHGYDAWHGSLWATPTLMVFFKDGPSEAYECWKPRKEEDANSTKA